MRGREARTYLSTLDVRVAFYGRKPKKPAKKEKTSESVAIPFQTSRLLVSLQILNIQKPNRPLEPSTHRGVGCAAISAYGRSQLDNPGLKRRPGGQPDLMDCSKVYKTEQLLNMFNSKKNPPFQCACLCMQTRFYLAEPLNPDRDTLKA